MSRKSTNSSAAQTGAIGVPPSGHRWAQQGGWTGFTSPMATKPCIMRAKSWASSSTRQPSSSKPPSSNFMRDETRGFSKQPSTASKCTTSSRSGGGNGTGTRDTGSGSGTKRRGPQPQQRQKPPHWTSGGWKEKPQQEPQELEKEKEQPQQEPQELES